MYLLDDIDTFYLDNITSVLFVEKKDVPHITIGGQVADWSFIERDGRAVAVDGKKAASDDGCAANISLVIHSDGVKKIKTRHVVNLVIENVLNRKKSSLNIGCAASIMVSADVEHLKCRISAAGSVQLTGHAEKGYLYLEGIGMLNMVKFKKGRARVEKQAIGFCQ